MTVVFCLLALSGATKQVLPIPLEIPPFEYALNSNCEGSESFPSLELVNCIENGVVDYDEWFNALPGRWPAATFHNGGINDAIRGDIPPDQIPSVLHTPGKGSFHLDQIINSSDFVIAFYGSPPNRFDVILYPRILVLMEKSTFESIAILDFLAYFQDPSQPPASDPVYTDQALKWADVKDGILYVSTAHRTYSEMSGGSNGYITAIDLSTLEIVWRSRSLVSNSQNFLLMDNVIVTGYGFTYEDDFVYMLNRNTGEVLQSVSVPTAPDYFFSDGNTVYVRCYSSDCVFSIN